MTLLGEGLKVDEMDYDWDFTAASQHLQKALTLHPGDARTPVSFTA